MVRAFLGSGGVGFVVGGLVLFGFPLIPAFSPSGGEGVRVQRGGPSGEKISARGCGVFGVSCCLGGSVGAVGTP